MNPYKITEDFENALAAYTGAPYVCAVNSCTAAIQLAALYKRPWLFLTVQIPRRTYVSVPNALKLAGYKVRWTDEDWQINDMSYEIRPLQIWDCARKLHSQMFVKGRIQCVSFSTTKVLGSEQGGAILHDLGPKAQTWFQRMRFDGRTPGVDPHDDVFDLVGLHCIMLPSTAAILNLKLHHLPKHPPKLSYQSYPDLSRFHTWD